MQAEFLLVRPRQGVDVLFVLAGAERGHDDGLGLAAGEQGRTVGAREDADFRNDVADLVESAAVDAVTVVDDVTTQDVGLAYGTVGVAGTLNVVNVGGTLAPGTSTETAAQHLDIYGGLTSSGTLGFELFSVTLGAGSAANSNSLKFFSDEQITLGGTLAVSNNTGTASSTWTEGTWFQLVDWNVVTAGNRSVNFTDISFLPALAGGLQWDVSQFATDGRIYVVVPEPGRAVLLLMGLMVCAVRRRRGRA